MLIAKLNGKCVTTAGVNAMTEATTVVVAANIRIAKKYRSFVEMK